MQLRGFAFPVGVARSDEHLPGGLTWEIIVQVFGTGDIVEDQ